MPTDSDLLQILELARERLVIYYVFALQEGNAREQVRFLSSEKETIFDLLTWCEEKERWEDLIHVVDSIGKPLGSLGQHNKKLTLGKAAAAACQKWKHDGWLEYQLWFDVRDVAWAMARLEQNVEAEDMWERSLKKAEEMGFRRVQALALRNLGQSNLFLHGGDKASLERALLQLAKSVELWEQTDEQEWLALTRKVLGTALLRVGKADEARNVLLQAWNRFMDLDHTDGIIESLAELAIAEGQLGNKDVALGYAVQAIRKAENDLASPAPAHAFALSRRAQLAALLGETPAIVRQLKEKAYSVYHFAPSTAWVSEFEQWFTEYELSLRKQDVDSLHSGETTHMDTHTDKRTKVFICYSHEDKVWQKRFQDHLSVLVDEGKLEVWDDTHIQTGTDWRQEIQQALTQTRVAVMLVSPNFLTSRFIREKEMPHILKAAQDSGVSIVLVAVSASMYTETVLEKYEWAYDPKIPLDTLHPAKRNKVLVEICQKIQVAYNK